MKRIEREWNTFIKDHYGAPFLLGDFIKQFLRPSKYNFRPRILVFSKQNKILGVVPVGIVDCILYKKCVFLLRPWYPAEFIFDHNHEKILLKETVLILLRKMGCHVVDFRLPAKSHNLSVLKQVCRESGIDCISYSHTGCATVPVDSSWSQFEKKRRHLRREIERTNRRLMEKGQLSIKWFGNGDDKTKIFKKILTIEKSSWKALQQKSKKFEVDASIIFVLNGCVQTALTVPLFNWGVAVLELNETPIAHSMFLEFNGHAYICKTSFNDNYRKLGPGIYINYAVVRELMRRNNIKLIDFMTNLPFSHKWASNVVPINRIIISKKGIGPLYLIRRVILERVFTTKGINNSLIKFVQLFVSEFVKYIVKK